MHLEHRRPCAAPSVLAGILRPRTFQACMCLAALSLLPHAVHAASAADCQQMDSQAAQNASLYSQHRDPAHLRAAQTYQNHARACWASVRGSGSAGGSGGAAVSPGMNRAAAALGLLQGLSSLLNDMSERDRRAQREANHRMADEANREGNRMSDEGEHELAVIHYERAIGLLQINGDQANLDLVEGNRLRSLERAQAARDRDAQRQREQQAQRNSEGSLASLASQYRSGASGTPGAAGAPDCTPARYDPAVCNFSDADPIWRSIRRGVDPAWCLNNGGVWNGLAQVCAISPERAAAAPPPEPGDPNTRWKRLYTSHQRHAFLDQAPVRMENCARDTCMYRNVTLAQCRAAGGIAYARPADGQYSGGCAVHTELGTPADISLGGAPVYRGTVDHFAVPQGDRVDTRTDTRTDSNPWGAEPQRSGISGGGGAGRPAGAGRTGPAN